MFLVPMARSFQAEDLILALSVPVPDLDDGSVNSLDQVLAHIERQELLSKVILGQASPDDYLELLASQGFSVDQFLDETEETLIDYC